MFTCSSPIYCVRCQRLTRISFERSPFGLLGEPCLTCPFQGWVPPFVRMRCLPHAEGGVIVLLSHVIDPPVVDRGLFQVAQVWVVRGICTRACIFPIYCMPRAPGSLDLLMCWLSPSSSACHLGATKCPGSCVIAVTDSCADSAASSHILRNTLSDTAGIKSTSLYLSNGCRGGGVHPGECVHFPDRVRAVGGASLLDPYDQGDVSSLRLPVSD